MQHPTRMEPKSGRRIGQRPAGPPPRTPPAMARVAARACGLWVPLLAALVAAGCQSAGGRAGPSAAGGDSYQDRYDAARARARANEPEPPRTGGLALRSASAVHPGMTPQEIEDASQRDPMEAYRALLDPK